uniref:Exportin-T n=1 Tax=Albugo laibachii Nc14 TaxID=890382 RepID=F0WG79_9STRA|nr:conserved hypothetical protein [Albugo laibachii Nc14]|eukprot:CCA20214.1 conserved hypothetical protein [Albugo laibachii Nc14]
MNAISMINVVDVLDASTGVIGVEAQRQANAILIDFVKTDECWKLSLEILRNSEAGDEVKFLTANMLHAKLKTDWIKLPDSDRHLIHNLLQNLMDETLYKQQDHGSNGYIDALLFKLYAIQAIKLLFDTEEREEYMLEATQNTQIIVKQWAIQREEPDNKKANYVNAFLTISRLMCEEFEVAKIPFTIRDATEEHLKRIGPVVLEVLAQLLVGLRDTSSSILFRELHLNALKCWLGWTQYCSVSTSSVMSQNDQLHAVLLHDICVSSDPSIVTNACEILLRAFQDEEEATTTQIEPHLVLISRKLLGTASAFHHAISTDDKGRCHAIVSVISAFMENFALWIVEMGPESQLKEELAKYMLTLLRCPHRQIAVLTLEFWLIAQECPVDNRSPYFRDVAYNILLQVIMEQSMYPADPDVMDELLLEDLESFRSDSQAVQDILSSMCSLSEYSFVVHMFQRLKIAITSWRLIEVCLYVVSTVISEVNDAIDRKLHVMNNSVFNLLSLILEHGARQLNHPFTLKLGATILCQVGTFWLNKLPHDQSSKQLHQLLTGIVKYLLEAMVVPHSQQSAAKSFLHLVTRCERIRQLNPDVYLPCLRKARESDMPHQDRLLLVEGLVRLATASLFCMQILGDVLNELISTFNGLLQSLPSLEYIVGHRDLMLSSIAEEVKALSKTIRCLESPDAVVDTKAVTRSVIEHVWPHITPVPQKLMTSLVTVDAINELNACCLQSLGLELASGLSYWVSLIAESFGKYKSLAPLQLSCVMVDTFGSTADGNKNSPHEAYLSRNMSNISTMVLQYAQHVISDDSDEILQTFFELCYRYLVFCPGAMVPLAEFQSILKLARICLWKREKSIVNEVLRFLTHLLSKSEEPLKPFEDQIMANMLQEYAQWLKTLLLALSEHAPDMSLDHVGRFFITFLAWSFECSNASEYCQTLLRDAMTAQAEVHGISIVPGNSREHTLRCWLRLAHDKSLGTKRLYRNLCFDFAKVCRKERTPDLLLEYN